MEFHKASNIFPMMSNEEFQALKTDMQANGLREPIYTFEGKVLDGRNRFNACQALGITPSYKEWNGSFEQAIQFVWSENFNRRHLTSSQKAAAAVEKEGLLDSFREKAKERKQEAGKVYGRGQQKVSQQIDTAKGRATEHIAKAVGTNRQYINDAIKLKEQAPERFEEVKAGTKTIPQVKREIRQEEIANRHPKALPEGKFTILLADPPWEYDFSLTDTRKIENQYPTMPLDEIAALPVEEIADADSVLFLWATSPKLLEALQVMKAWGFTYVTNAIWDKEKIGMGYYFRQQHELLLVGRKGKPPLSLPESRHSSVIRELRTQHSAKPLKVYEILEGMYPNEKKIELFARNQRTGWEPWGTENGINGSGTEN